MSLSSTNALLAYYLGLGFIVVLGWAASHPDRELDHETAGRYLRWSRVAAVVGLVHPAIGLAARDIVGQVGSDMPDDTALRRQQQRTARTANVLAVVSAAVAVALLAAVAL
jgi:hypothetical protein